MDSNTGKIIQGGHETGYYYKGRNQMRIPDNLGMILLGLYLIIEGVLRLSSGGIGIILGLLAFFAGILILVRNIRR